MNLRVMAHPEAVPSPAQPICVWSDDSGKIEIHLRPSVMERLSTDSWVAFKRVPRRGLEIGGVLLGHADHRDGAATFWIDGFAAVESEYRSGPSYLPSEPDLARLQDEIKKNGPSSIGLFRSHTRSEPMALQDPDAELLKRYFDPADAVFLIVGPVPGKAALFIRTNGNLHCIHEFPLPSLSSILTPRQDPHAQETALHRDAGLEIRSAVRHAISRLESPRNVDAGTVGDGEANLDHQAVVPPPLNAYENALDTSGRKNTDSRDTAMILRPARIRKVRRVRWIFLAALTALAVTAAVSLRIYFISGLPAPARSPFEYIGLEVEREGSSLRVHWDRNSTMLHDATHAVLHVRDGETQVDRIVTTSELNTGSVAYEPKNSDVSFGLDVYSSDPRARGMVQVMNLPTQVEIQRKHPEEPQIRPKPDLTALTPILTLPFGVRPQPALAQPIAKPDNPAELLSPVAARPGGETQQLPIAVAKPSDDIGTKAVSAADLPVPKASEQPSEPQAAIARETAVPRTGGPSVSVSAEAIPSSKIGRVVGRVPLLRRLVNRESVEPPVPVYQAQPSVALPNQQGISHLAMVDVRVDVAKSGKVTFAEITDWGNPPNFSLANAALASAKQWTFKPARTEDLPVSSQVILHFRFNP